MERPIPWYDDSRLGQLQYLYFEEIADYMEWLIDKAEGITIDDPIDHITKLKNIKE